MCYCVRAFICERVFVAFLSPNIVFESFFTFCTQIAAIKEQDPTANPSRWHTVGGGVTYATRMEAEEQREKSQQAQLETQAQLESSQKEAWDLMYYGASKSKSKTEGGGAGSGVTVEELDDVEDGGGGGDLPPALGNGAAADDAAAASADSVVPVLPDWCPELDAALSALVRPCLFDFDKVATQLQTQLEGRGMARTRDGARTVLCTPDACRKRFAALKKQEKERGAGAAAGGGAAGSETKSARKEFKWTPALDSKLPSLVRAHAFDFAKVASALAAASASQHGGGVSPDEVRTRFAQIKKKQQQQRKVPAGGVWTPTLDKQLQKLGRSCGFVFE